MGALSIQDKYSNTVAIPDMPEEGVSALDLFNTPHQFAKPKMGTTTTTKRAIRY